MIDKLSKILMALSVAAALTLSGCTALVVGGAAAGGYYIGKDERSAGQIAEDGSITARVKSKLIGDPYVKAFQVNVDTYENIVTLRGTVGSFIARTQAEEVARSVSGVESVVNEIEVINEP